MIVLPKFHMPLSTILFKVLERRAYTTVLFGLQLDRGMDKMRINDCWDQTFLHPLCQSSQISFCYLLIQSPHNYILKCGVPCRKRWQTRTTPSSRLPTTTRRRAIQLKVHGYRPNASTSARGAGGWRTLVATVVTWCCGGWYFLENGSLSQC